MMELLKIWGSGLEEGTGLAPDEAGRGIIYSCAMEKRRMNTPAISNFY